MISKNFGQELAEECQTIILAQKFQLLGDALMDYYNTTNNLKFGFFDTKTKENEEKVKTILKHLYFKGELDYWYNRYLAEYKPKKEVK